MQEDIVGTLRTIGGHDTAICSLCGAPYPVDQLTPIEADLMDGALSEREDVCPECRKSLAQGENPAFPIETEGDSLLLG